MNTLYNSTTVKGGGGVKIQGPDQVPQKKIILHNPTTETWFKFFQEEPRTHPPPPPADPAEKPCAWHWAEEPPRLQPNGKDQSSRTENQPGKRFGFGFRV